MQTKPLDLLHLTIMTMVSQLLSRLLFAIRAVLKTRTLALAILQMQQLHLISYVQALTPICTNPLAPDTIDQPASTLGPAIFLAKGTSLIEHIEFDFSPDLINPGIDVHELVSFALISWDSKKCTGVEVVKSLLQKSSVIQDKSLYSVVTRFYPNDPLHPELSYHDKYPNTITPRPMKGTSLRFAYQFEPANPSKWVQQIKAFWTSHVTEMKDKKPVTVETYLSDLLYVDPDNFAFNPMPVNSFMFSVRAYSKNSVIPTPGGNSKPITYSVVFENFTISLQKGDPDLISAILSKDTQSTLLEGITHDEEFKHWSIEKVSLPRWESVVKH